MAGLFAVLLGLLAAGGEVSKLGIAPRYYTTQFDFRLKPAAAGGSDMLDAQRRLAALGAAE